MLNTKPKNRSSANTLLQIPELASIKRGMFLDTNQNQSLEFPLCNAIKKGIIGCFTKCLLHDFLEQLSFDTSDSNHETSFNLFTCNFQNYLSLCTNEFYQLSLKQNKVQIDGYLIQSTGDCHPQSGK
jgi:hypothetical protein